MTESTPANSVGFIEFIECHRPELDDGDYQITITQELESTDQKIPANTTFTTTRNFTVAGERFALNPADIHAVFPPEGSLGEHSNVLPHVILNRSTLPWEREAEKGKKDAPWLALLLFDDKEKPRPRILTLKQLQDQSRNPKPGEGTFPVFELESAQHLDDLLTVIDVRQSLLKSIMPEWEELKLLAHVRAGKDAEEDPTGEELAVVIGNRLPDSGVDSGVNRLPRAGKSSTVHLVSVENRFEGAEFNYHGAGKDDLISLVSLKSWSFACEDKPSFKGLLENLNHGGTEPAGNPGALRLPLRSCDREAARFLDQGYVLLPHFFRQGDKTASWYRGPLIPGEDPTEISLPVRAADELLRYDPDLGMFDVSYAAAWELGRLLALQNKQFSTGLFRWKRAHVQQLAQTEQRLLHPHLANHGKSVVAGSMPEELSSWLEGLSLLRGVPFNYLVPDEDMLPPESIRFFQVDGLWLECLLDGAFSIGRVTANDHKKDQALSDRGAAAKPFETVTGILLRSEVVRGWPGLLVDAYYDKDPLPLLRMERLSADVLICLFDGSFNVIEATRLIHSLMDQTNPVSKHVAAKLAPEVNLQLRRYLELPAVLKPELNQVIAGPLLYDEDRFKNVELSPELKQLIAERPAGPDLLRLNRALLQAAYADEIAEGSGAFAEADFKAPNDLARKLKEQKDPLANYLYRKFAIENRQRLDIANQSDQDLVATLVAELKRLIAGPSLYDAERFAQVPLSAEIKDLAAQNPQGKDLIRLNRALLEAAYPPGIPNQRVEIHQKPETLHFGVDKPDDPKQSFSKKLRDTEGNESNQAIPIPWRLGPESRVIKIKELAGESNSAQFALQMIEGVEKVVFCSG